MSSMSTPESPGISMLSRAGNIVRTGFLTTTGAAADGFVLPVFRTSGVGEGCPTEIFWSRGGRSCAETPLTTKARATKSQLNFWGTVFIRFRSLVEGSLRHEKLFGSAIYHIRHVAPQQFIAGREFDDGRGKGGCPEGKPRL